jgi:hypothetical protein
MAGLSPEGAPKRTPAHPLYGFTPWHEDARSLSRGDRKLLVMAGQKREARLRARCPGHPRLLSDPNKKDVDARVIG